MSDTQTGTQKILIYLSILTTTLSGPRNFMYFEIIISNLHRIEKIHIKISNTDRWQIKRETINCLFLKEVYSIYQESHIVAVSCTYKKTDHFVFTYDCFLSLGTIHILRKEVCRWKTIKQRPPMFFCMFCLHFYFGWYEEVNLIQVEESSK